MDHMEKPLFTRAMLLLLVCLCVMGMGGMAAAEDSLSAATPSFGQNGAEGGFIEALTIDNLPTRSGPGTKYRETGTYKVKDEYVRVISQAYDHGGVCWIQCEVLYGNKLRRVYTGLKRFDSATVDLASLPGEEPLAERVKVIATSKAMYGPGAGYDTYGSLTVDKGQTVTVMAMENDYAQVEWTTTKQSYRAWVPAHTLKYQVNGRIPAMPPDRAKGL